MNHHHDDDNDVAALEHGTEEAEVHVVRRHACVTTTTGPIIIIIKIITLIIEETHSIVMINHVLSQVTGLARFRYVCMLCFMGLKLAASKSIHECTISSGVWFFTLIGLVSSLMKVNCRGEKM